LKTALVGLLHPSLSRYPLDEPANADFNVREEHRCPEEAEKMMTGYHKEVAAVVIEPVQSESGDDHTTPSFFAGFDL
jgi:4-aminobutyrate aminotransferase/(S)-3-amino-2-methylpropionate transaminase